MRISKKILAIALSILMAVSMMPFTVFADTLPPATMTALDVTNLPNDTSALGGQLDVAYKFEATQSAEDFASSPYQNYVADFVISFDKDVPANTVYLAGSYDNYEGGKWVEFTSDQLIPAGTEIHLLQTVLASMGFDSNFTYKDVYETVQTFYCGARGLDNAGTTIDVALNLYESEENGNGGYQIKEGAEAITLKDKKYVFEGDDTLPTATVTPIEVEGLDVAYSFVADQTAEEAAASMYKDYLADFAISFDKDVKAGAVQLGGSYQGYNNGEWVFFTLAEGLGVADDYVIPAGTEIKLLETALTNLGYDSAFTYEDIVKTVGEFKCGAKGLDAAGVKLTAALNLYEDAQADATAIAEEGYTFPLNTDMPTATVTPIEVEGLDVAYSFVADQTAEEAAASMYKDYLADFAISFDKDVKAGAVQLGGSYQGYNNGEWVFFTLAEGLGVADDYVIPAGTEIKLLETALTNLGYDSAFTYEDIVKTVGEFKCGAKGLDAAGVKLTAALNLYEDAQADATAIAEEEYTFPAVAEDSYSITVADEISLNIYVGNTGNISKIAVTADANPEAEDATQGEIASYEDADLEGILSDGAYAVRVPLAPAQIRDNIAVVAYNGSTVVKTINKTVAEYCEDMLAGNYTANEKALAQAVLDYGKACSNYFGYAQDKFANYNIVNTEATFGNYGKGSASGIAISEVKFVTKSVPELRFVVSGVTEEEVADIALTSSIGQASFVKSETGEEIYVQVTGIPASKLGQEIQVTGEGISITYTPLRWAQLAASNSDSAELGVAIANYSNAAAAVFTN